MHLHFSGSVYWTNRSGTKRSPTRTWTQTFFSGQLLITLVQDDPQMTRSAKLRKRKKARKPRQGTPSSDSDLEPPHGDASKIIQTPVIAEHVLPPLLRLPAELRNCIYALSLARDEPFAIDNYCMGRSACAKRHPGGRSTCLSTADTAVPGQSAIGLLRANRQICREATAIFYGMNTFDLLPITADLFLSSIGQSLRHLRSVIVHSSNLTGTLSALDRYLPPKLEKIAIHIGSRMASVAGPGQWCTWIAREMVPFVCSVGDRKHEDYEDIIAWFSAAQKDCDIDKKHFTSLSDCTDEFLSLRLRQELRRLLTGARPLRRLISPFEHEKVPSQGAGIRLQGMQHRYVPCVNGHLREQ